MEILIAATALAGLIVGAAALVIGCLAFIEVKSLKQSTHSIEYVNPQSLMAGPTDEALEREARKAGIAPADFTDERDDEQASAESLEDL